MFAEGLDHQFFAAARRCAAGWVPTLALCGVLAFAGCGSDSASHATAQAQRGGGEVVPVVVAAAARKDVPNQLRAIGTVEAYSTVAIKSQVEGQLAQVHFREGQRVDKGDLLFTIDHRPFDAALRQAEANLAQNRVEAANAEVELKRRTELLAQGFVSKDEYDQAETRAASLRAAGNAAAAAVEHARLELEYCDIRSPIDGRIGQILVHQGNVVKENETTLAVINQIRPIYVSFSVPERELPGIRERVATGPLTVAASVPHRGGLRVTGELRFINNTVDTNTGTVLLKGLFTNDDEALWPGQFVDVSLTLSTQRDALVVPAEAVQTGQQGQYVFVIGADRKAEVRPVVAAPITGPEVVVAQGLAPGELVVTDGQVRLTSGTKVEIKTGASADGRSGSAGG